MVTDDYRGYRKGVYVRFPQTPEVRFQNGSQEAGTQMPRRRPVADGSRAQTAVTLERASACA